MACIKVKQADGTWKPVAAAYSSEIKGLPEEAFNITGDCSYRFANNGWNWFINEFGNQITTKNIKNCTNMFKNMSDISIPFEINCSGNQDIFSYMFTYSSLTSIPKISNAQPKNMDNMFSGCSELVELPEDIGEWFDWSYTDNITNTYDGNRANMFYGAYNLRSIPMNFLRHANPNSSNSTSYYYNGFPSCYSLDELVGLPIPYIKSTWTSNAFYATFNSCSRVKNITFATQENGSPIVVKWKTQTIDLSKELGYGSNVAASRFKTNLGIDKQIKDDNTYAALKNDKDSWTTDVAYSRYNHDSAVATINSLPDASAYLASVGGTNTIKFKGTSGSKTDGGAINTLTEAEIAVATEKGWTVSLV